MYTLRPSTVTTYAPILLVLFVGLSVPLRAVGVAPQQGAMALALIFALVLLANTAQNRHAIAAALKSFEGKAVLAMFAAWAITVPFSFNPMGSLHIGGRTGLFVLAATVIWAGVKTNPSTHRFLCKVVIVSALVLTIAAALSLLGVPYILSALKLEALPFESPEKSFKAFAAAAMCLIPVMAWAGRRLSRGWRWAGYAFAPVTFYIILETNNRSALVGVLAIILIGSALLAVKWRRHTKSLLALMFIAAIGVITWIHNTQDWRAQIDGTYLPIWLIDPHRQYIWKFAFENFLNHPFVGNGIDQINRIPGSHEFIPEIGAASYAYFVPSHPHNWLLEVLSETGVLGFATMVFALAAVAWKRLRTFLAHENDADLTLLTLMAGFWASALFNFSIWAAWWQLVFLVLFAIVAGARTTGLGATTKVEPSPLS